MVPLLWVECLPDEQPPELGNPGCPGANPASSPQLEPDAGSGTEDGKRVLRVWYRIVAIAGPVLLYLVKSPRLPDGWRVRGDNDIGALGSWRGRYMYGGWVRVGEAWLWPIGESSSRVVVIELVWIYRDFGEFLEQCFWRY